MLRLLDTLLLAHFESGVYILELKFHFLGGLVRDYLIKVPESDALVKKTFIVEKK